MPYVPSDHRCPTCGERMEYDPGDASVGVSPGWGCQNGECDDSCEGVSYLDVDDEPDRLEVLSCE